MLCSYLIASSTKCNKPNEVYDPCDAPCPGRSCDVDPRLVKCGRPPQVGDENCVVGCRCMDGYFRNKNGRCVPWDQCPKKQPTCGPNEVYDECDAPCPGRSCDVDPRLVRCKAPPKPGDEECIKGCRCKDGFARNKKGQCIPREKCPPKQPVCGKNEVYDECDAPCPGRTCDVDPALVLCKTAPKPGDKDCVEGCRCIDGYARDQNGNCIPRDQCPPKPTCGPNEEYDPCPDCSPQTCEMMNQTYHCPRLPASKMGPGCHPSCRCKKEYFRNKIGECIHSSDCAKCTKPHEYFSCGGACDNVCENIKEQNQTNCPIINIQCNKMCYCEADYARDYKGDCIPIKDCPTCPENERYDPCPATLCGPKTCDEAGFPLNCTQREEGAKCPGKPGCVCKDGYLRDKNGKCIPTDQCPSCGGDKNATLGCGVNCNRHCSDLDQEEPRMCILVCYPNSCDCRTDSQGRKYYYDSNLKMCVLAEDCTPQCKENEVYSKCANGGCTKQKCTDINKPVVCVYPKICKKGCVCAPGYLRAKNGTCVPSEQCDPPPKCKSNEEFSKCGRDGCLKYYCSDLDLPPLCRDTFQCIPQCECKEGYLRASVDNSTCVPVDQCPRRCKENEQYSECPAATCQPQTCKEAGYPVPCPIVGPDGQCSGDPGCICVPGYLRNDKGKCIPQDQCPSCGGDKNAVPGCGNHCGNTCATYNSTKPVPCPLYCDLNGCNCREKYVYDENLHKCVLPKDCTPKCKANEEFSTCSNAICRAQYCADKDKPVACPAIAKGYCKKGCVCKEHYLRDKKGNCIPEKECKPNDLCPKGEIFSHCPPIQCDAEYCPKSRDAPQRCPMPKKCGPPRCICPFNHHRHRNNCKCIPTAKCRPFPCDGPNEHYDSCPPVCRDKSCTDYLKNVTCPKFSLSVKVACRPACLCNEGYYRDSEGICVSAKECIGKIKL
ncbi:hypothetical protein ABMA28_015747 [Loxostege sticticalis]|uniref:TIL domain-containing protein n=1 Tax=Loxostege sticticalis TaxID=481309 RepID=A0ABD0TAX1_LOXSC